MSDKPCEFCKDLVETNCRKRHIEPHKYLKAIDSKSYRPAMVAGYEETTYECSNCGARILYNNDKNDMIHWFLV